MEIFAIKTHKITKKDTSIFSILDRYLPRLKERTIVAVTSKIVALCEGRVRDPKTIDKEKLIMQEAEYYLPRTSNKYNVMPTIKNGIIAFSSGVDESNANGLFVLWPLNPQKSANEIRSYLQKKFGVKNLGVIITDTTSMPLRRGQMGIMIGYSGFAALKSYIGKEDIFKSKLKMTKASVTDALAIASVLVMGEGKEQTPLAIIEDVPFVQFCSRNPSKKELAELHIALEDDLYAPLLKAMQWRKGG